MARKLMITDSRNLLQGTLIYEDGYMDQPYVVKYYDGSWICVFTTGRGQEGDPGQYIMAIRSKDRGKTWDSPVAIEPPSGPAASWAMPFLSKNGRLYVFYTYNGDKITTLNGRSIRNDMLGWYCYKYSDDAGLTWSDRFRIPIRKTKIDELNEWHGTVQCLWGIGKPIRHDGSMILAFSKIGKHPVDKTEGWMLKCTNIDTERDAGELRWEMLPRGKEEGIQNPAFGSIQEEHNIVALSNGTLYCVYRTTIGFIGVSKSLDGGISWSLPSLLTYATGKRIKNPRACPRLWKCENGRYLLWFHNNSGKSFDGRNPAWITGGIERCDDILWAQPEILLYADDPRTRMSYPDLIEENGSFWITETQKEVARVHEIDPTLLEGLWNQLLPGDIAGSSVPPQEPVFQLQETEIGNGDIEVSLPKLPRLNVPGAGITLDFALELRVETPGQVILDNRDFTSGKGLYIATGQGCSITIILSDGINTFECTSEPGKFDLFKPTRVAVLLDGEPRILTFVIDGQVCDGGIFNEYGWTRFPKNLGDLNSPEDAYIAPITSPERRDSRPYLRKLRIYDRCFRISEIVKLHRVAVEFPAS